MQRSGEVGQIEAKSGSASHSLIFPRVIDGAVMIEVDPLSMVLIANDAASTILQAGPPSDLPGAVPDFVSDILDAIRNIGGEGGLGEKISELTPN